MSDEARVQSEIRLASSRLGWLLMRNNVGACRDDTGRVIRYGLMNESKRLNDEIKSSDLIGIVPLRIEPHHVGLTLGIFTAVEVKQSDWRGVSNDRERAQERFINLVKENGGFAKFATNARDLTDGKW